VLDVHGSAVQASGRPRCDSDQGWQFALLRGDGQDGEKTAVQPS
jgi:hypothetical protein